MRSSTLQIVLWCLVGAVVGVGSYAFIYARGYSYLLNNPSACANCHVMNDQYSGWMKSSHHSAATCNDCHTPHNVFGKYAVKAMDGFFHSFYFTTGNYPDNIQISSLSHKVVESSCRRCHAAITQAMGADNAAQNVHGRAQGVECTRCHLSVGHMEGAAFFRNRNLPVSEQAAMDSSVTVQLSGTLPGFRFVRNGSFGSNGSNHDER